MGKDKELDELEVLFDLEPIEQVKRQIVDVRRRLRGAEAKNRSTAITQLSQQEDRLWRELRRLQGEAATQGGGTRTGLEGASEDEVVAVVDGALRELPSHMVDRIGAVVDELRQVTPTRRLKVIPGGR